MTSRPKHTDLSTIPDAIDVSSDPDSSEEEKPVIEPVSTSRHRHLCKICDSMSSMKLDHLRLCSKCYAQQQSKNLLLESKSESEQQSVLMAPRELRDDPDVDWEAHFGTLQVCQLKYISLSQ